MFGQGAAQRWGHAAGSAAESYSTLRNSAGNPVSGPVLGRAYFLAVHWQLARKDFDLTGSTIA